MELDTILGRGVALAASDVHLKVNRPPMLRSHGRLVPMEGASQLTSEHMEQLLARLLDGHATHGMQTFDQSLMALFREDLITYEEALAQATNPDDFALKVRGIASTSDARWDQFDKSERADNGQAAAFKIDRF
jgi:Tfp pilus assembly pilus retraction ATPase PilT